MIKRNDIYIYFTKILGGLGVIENIFRRLKLYADEETVESILNGFTYPPLGTQPENMPYYTCNLMNKLKANLK